ncbi:MAG: GNAT family N-acetyltransferase [Cyanobacteria bacterium P01_G01_bin.67]
MQVRFATIDDVALIYQLIQGKAEFDRSVGAYSGRIQTCEAKIRQTIFNEQPFAHVLFAEILTENSPEVIGFALYGFRYSSFAGQPSIWLDDLYVKLGMRSKGAGGLLMKRLRQIAQENNCTHLAWTADARNTRGLGFYQRLGAKITEQKENRCWLRWSLPS